MKTIDQLRQLIHTKFDIDPATIADDVPFADYNLDSLTLAELVFEIEDTFKVDFPDDFSQVKTLGDLAGVLDGLLAKAAPAATTTAP